MSIAPMMDAPVNRRPSAAVATGLVLCTCCAVATKTVESTAEAIIAPFDVIHLISLSIQSKPSYFFLRAANTTRSSCSPGSSKLRSAKRYTTSNPA